MDGEMLVEVYGDGDPAEADRLALALRQELLEIAEVDAVTAASAGPPPPGTRGVDLAAVGALAVSFGAPAVEVLGKLLTVVQGWLARRGDETQLRVTIGDKSIELTATREQRDQLVASFLDAVAADE